MWAIAQPATQALITRQVDVDMQGRVQGALMSLVSVAAGMFGWTIGRVLGDQPWVERRLGRFRDEHGPFVRRYGFWAIAIGAITPFPYSMTCWSAGMLGVPARTVLGASLLFRLPRFLLYYWLIVSTGSLL